MVREMINGTFRQTNLPNESEEYLSKREELRRAEIELRQKTKTGIRIRRYLFLRRTMTGTIRHSYTGHPWLAQDIKERGIDELTPIWNVMDLTRQGRGEFYAKLEYPKAA